MPELPEVENVAVALRACLLGRRLDGIRARFAGSLEPSPAAARRALLGRRLVEVTRHGKYVFLGFGPRDAEARRAPPPKGRPARTVAAAAAEAVAPYPAAGPVEAQLMLHLRMTGQVFVRSDYRPDKHLRLVFDFEGRSVYYRDIRKFGRFVLLDGAPGQAAIPHVGPDMLEVSFGEWKRRLGERRAPLKSLLLHQGIAAGLGNIYADECLHRARIHPLAAPRDLDDASLRALWSAARRVLRESIKKGGTTYQDFVDFHGRPGNFKQKLRVYGRTGEPCGVCGTGVERLVVGGRSTHFCPACQDFGPAASA